jgi:hypothetical protein
MGEFDSKIIGGAMPHRSELHPLSRTGSASVKRGRLKTPDRQPVRLCRFTVDVPHNTTGPPVSIALLDTKLLNPLLAC